MRTNNYALSGKVVLITGGTGFIGLAITKAVLNSGGSVICASSSQNKAEQIREQFPKHGDVIFCKIDVRDEYNVTKSVKAVANYFGKIDALVNCAGVNLKKPFLATTTEDFKRVIDTNLLGAVRVSQAVCRHMIARKAGGIIINICSVASTQALSDVTTYAVSKAGLLSLTRQMAVDAELIANGIRTIAVVPGFIPTEQNRRILSSGDRGSRILLRTPLERYGTPEEIAEVVAFCLSDAASFMNGCSIAVDGGFMATGVSEAMAGKLKVVGIPDILEDISTLDGCARTPEPPTTSGDLGLGQDRSAVTEPPA